MSDTEKDKPKDVKTEGDPLTADKEDVSFGYFSTNATITLSMKIKVQDPQ